MIKDPTVQRMMRGGSDEDIRRWHSKAADWCSSHGRNHSERIRHLAEARRDREAVKMVKANR